MSLLGYKCYLLYTRNVKIEDLLIKLLQLGDPMIYISYTPQIPALEQSPSMQ